MEGTFGLGRATDPARYFRNFCFTMVVYKCVVCDQVYLDTQGRRRLTAKLNLGRCRKVTVAKALQTLHIETVCK